MLYKCTKILKIIEQEWGKDSDLYGSAEEACIYGGYNALLKVLEDYDCMDYADDNYEPMPDDAMDDENMSYTYPTYPDDDNEPEPLDESKKSNNMKKQTVKLNESQLRNLIRKTLNEYHDGAKRYLYHNKNVAKGIANHGRGQQHFDDYDRDETTYGEYEDEQWLHDHPVKPNGYLNKRDAIPTFDGGIEYGELNEARIGKAIRENLKKMLKEYAQDIDDDTYFGGGLPDKQSAQRITYEKEIKNILKEMKPYIDKLCKIYNNTECDNDSYDKVMDVIIKLGILNQTASDFYELNLP